MRTALEEGVIEGFAEIRERVRERSRDNARTPMQWNSSTNAGFTEGEPWIPLNSNYEEINVANARTDPDSIYAYYRELIALRKREDVLIYGEYDLLYPDHKSIYAYTRTLESNSESGGESDAERALVVLNFSDETPAFELPAEIDSEDPKLLIANYEDVEAGEDREGIGSFELRPWEARVYRLE